MKAERDQIRPLARSGTNASEPQTGSIGSECPHRGPTSRLEPMMRASQSEPGASSFAWPPRAPICVPAPPPRAQSDQSSDKPMDAMGRLLDSIELDLLGRTTLSFDRWARRTGWVPDGRDAYCWRCAGSVGPHEQDGEGCATCRAKKLPWDRALRLGRYEDELRHEVLALKFQGWRPGGHGLGRFMGEIISAQLGRAQIAPNHARLVPVPTNPWRRFSRGVDHTLVLARAASTVSGCQVARVLRARYRPEQVGLSATARARNMKGAFEPRTRTLRRRGADDGDAVRVWVLIDDVRTTGATFTACSKALRRGLASFGGETSAQIWICSVAVAGERGRRGADKMLPEVVIRAGVGAALTNPVRKGAEVHAET